MTALFNHLIHVVAWMLGTGFVVSSFYPLAVNWRSTRSKVLAFYMINLALCLYGAGYFAIIQSGPAPNWISILYPLTKSVSISGFPFLVWVALQPFAQYEDERVSRTGTRGMRKWMVTLIEIFLLLLLALPILMTLRVIIRDPTVSNLREYATRNEWMSVKVDFSLAEIFWGVSFALALFLVVYTLATASSAYDGVKNKAAWYLLAGMLTATTMVPFTYLLNNDPPLVVLYCLALGSTTFVGGLALEEKELFTTKGKTTTKMIALMFGIGSAMLVGVYASMATLSSNPERLWLSSIGFLGFALVLLFFLIQIAVKNVLKPLGYFSQVAEDLKSADLSYRTNFDSRDEFGALAEAINRVLAHAESEVSSHAKKVSLSAHHLELYRSQVQAVSKVVNLATTLQDLPRFLQETAVLISEQFGYSHVGIFLIDDLGEYAVLAAVSGEGEQKTPPAGFKVEIGQVHPVGVAASTGRVFLNLQGAPLQATEVSRSRAEIAVPLKVMGRVLGVLDVHSKNLSGFSKDEQDLVNLLADYLAVAIDSAQNLKEYQHAKQELNALYTGKIATAWKEKLQRTKLAYRYNRISVEPVEPTGGIVKSSIIQPGYQVEIPVSIRGQTLGSLVLRREEGQSPWTDEEFALAVDAVNQIVPALENARLLDEIEQRVELERLLGQLSMRIQGSLNLENVMRTTVEELGKLISANRIRLRIADAQPMRGVSTQGGDGSNGESLESAQE